MKTVNIHEAKTHLSRLLADVERGEEVIVARNGRPIARITRLLAGPGRGLVGCDASLVAAGSLAYSDDVDAPLPAEEAELFEG